MLKISLEYMELQNYKPKVKDFNQLLMPKFT